METIKKYWGAFVALVIGVLYALLRREQGKVVDAKAELAATEFKLKTQENDKKYEESKTNADAIVDEYKRARADDK